MPKLPFPSFSPSRVAATFVAPKNKRRGNFHYEVDPLNPPGLFYRARRGGRGMRGLRADLRDGRITLREIAHMSLYDLAFRYRVRVQGARYLKRCALDWNGGTVNRNLDGSLRDGYAVDRQREQAAINDT